MFKKIKQQISFIRSDLPDPFPGLRGRHWLDYKLMNDYKENRFSGPESEETSNDIKCHILAGKWSVLELRK